MTSNAYYGRSEVCCVCDKQSTRDLQFWHLRGYHGLTGFFCPECYRLVSHDAWGNPTDPQGYAYVVGVLLI